jgi:hypothetical protein
MLVDGIPMNTSERPEYCSTLNWTQLFVDTMTPYVYASVPNRLASPIRPQFPAELTPPPPQVDPSTGQMVQQSPLAQQMAAAIQLQQQKDMLDKLICFQLQWVLNWSPRVYDGKREGRKTTQEGLSKGAGIRWLEMDDAPVLRQDGTPFKMPTLRADDFDNFFIDSDAKDLRDAGFIIRKRLLPAYKVAELYGEDVDMIRQWAKDNITSSLYESVRGTTVNAGDDSTKGDIILYYELWSRIGLGEKLVGAPEDLKKNQDFVQAMEQIGRYVHFAILPGMERPLGLDPVKLTALASQAGNADTTPPKEPDSDEQAPAANPNSPAKPGSLVSGQLLAVLRAALEWPIKTYGNAYNPWPCRMLGFKPQVNSAYPKAILESGLPIQRFLDRTYEHIMSRIGKAGRDVCIYHPSLGELFQAALLSKNDLMMVPIDDQNVKEAIEKMVHFLAMPEMNKDIFKVLEVCFQAFREITGTTEELMGGVPHTQDRSAEASKIRGSGLSRRPDDYAEAVEGYESECAALEAVAWRMPDLTDWQLVAFIFDELEQQPDGSKQVPMTAGPPTAGPNGMQTPGEPQINWLAMPLTSMWMNFVQTKDEYRAASEINYQVEAGSGKRKNLQLLQQNVQQMWTMYGQQTFAMLLETADPTPMVLLGRMVAEAYQMPMEPFLTALATSMQQAAMARQQQMGGQPPSGGPPGKPGQPGGPGGQPQAPSPGQTPAQSSQSNPSAGRLTTSYVRAAGGPVGPHLTPPPETGPM